jgi:hypothetical protein
MYTTGMSARDRENPAQMAAPSSTPSNSRNIAMANALRSPPWRLSQEKTREVTEQLGTHEHDRANERVHRGMGAAQAA